MNGGKSRTSEGKVQHEFSDKNAVFGVFLTLNLFFRRTDPELVSAACLYRGCTDMDLCPGRFSSAPRTRGVSVFPVPPLRYLACRPGGPWRG